MMMSYKKKVVGILSLFFLVVLLSSSALAFSETKTVSFTTPTSSSSNVYDGGSSGGSSSRVTGGSGGVVHYFPSDEELDEATGSKRLSFLMKLYETAVYRIDDEKHTISVKEISEEGAVLKWKSVIQIIEHSEGEFVPVSLDDDDVYDIVANVKKDEDVSDAIKVVLVTLPDDASVEDGLVCVSDGCFEPKSFFYENYTAEDLNETVLLDEDQGKNVFDKENYEEYSKIDMSGDAKKSVVSWLWLALGVFIMVGILGGSYAIMNPERLKAWEFSLRKDKNLVDFDNKEGVVGSEDDAELYEGERSSQDQDVERVVCSSCGAENLKSTWRKCPQCGTPLSKERGK